MNAITISDFHICSWFDAELNRYASGIDWPQRARHCLSPIPSSMCHYIVYCKYRIQLSKHLSFVQTCTEIGRLSQTIVHELYNPKFRKLWPQSTRFHPPYFVLKLNATATLYAETDSKDVALKKCGGQRALCPIAPAAMATEDRVDSSPNADAANGKIFAITSK